MQASSNFDSDVCKASAELQQEMIRSLHFKQRQALSTLSNYDYLYSELNNVKKKDDFLMDPVEFMSMPSVSKVALGDQTLLRKLFGELDK